MRIWRAIGASLLFAAVAAIGMIGFLAYDSWRVHRPLTKTVEWAPKAYMLAREGKCKEASSLVGSAVHAGDSLGGAVRTEFNLNERCALVGDHPDIVEHREQLKEWAFTELPWDLERLGTTPDPLVVSTTYDYVERAYSVDRRRYGLSWQLIHVHFERLRNWRACYSSNVSGDPTNHVLVALAMAPYNNGVPARIREIADRRLLCAQRVFQFVKLRQRYFGATFDEPEYRKVLEHAERFGSAEAEFERVIRDIEDGPRDLCKYGSNSHETYDQCAEQPIELEAPEEAQRRQYNAVDDLAHLALSSIWFTPAQAKLAEYIFNGTTNRLAGYRRHRTLDAYYYGRLAQIGGATLSFDLDDVRKQLSEEDLRLVKGYIQDHAEWMRSQRAQIENWLGRTK